MSTSDRDACFVAEAVREVDIAHSGQTVSEAVEQLEAEVRNARRGREAVLLVVHGFGKSDVGGAIKAALSTELSRLARLAIVVMMLLRTLHHTRGQSIIAVSRRLTGSKGGGAMQWFIYDLRHLPFGTRPRTQRMLACFAGLLFGTFAVLSLPVEVGASSPNVVAQPTDLGTLGGTDSGAIAVSDRGQVVGESTTAGDTATHAFSWTAGGGMVDLGTLGGTTSVAIAVSDRGQVVGSSFITGDTVIHAFSWTVGGGMVDLGTLGGTTSVARAVNDRGQVVGGSSITGDTASHAFSWTAGGGMVDLGTLGGTFSGASAVNASGQVVGASSISGEAATHAFSWTSGGGMVDLGTLGGTSSFLTIQGSAFEGNGGGVNDRGQVVGGSSISGDTALHAFSWTSGGGIVDLGTLGGTDSFSFAVNGRGQVVGESSTSGNTASHAFSWTSGGGMVDLGTLGGTFSGAIAVNGSGQVVGGSNTTGDTASHAFSWSAGGGMVDLGTLPGGQQSGARAVNARGQVVGESFTSTGTSHAVLWPPA